MLLQENKATMSSREIAEYTGKRHSDVMRDIRNILSQLNGSHNERMSALVKKSDDEKYHRSDRTQYKYLRKDTIDYLFDHAFKSTGYNFELSEYSDSKGEKRPEYTLTKKDVLLLISGYDAVLRSKVINRWEDLETRSKQIDFTNPDTVLKLVQNWKDAEVEKERLQHQLQLQSGEIIKAAPKVEYFNIVMQSVSTYTTTQIAKELGMGAPSLNCRLQNLKVQYKQSGTWVLYEKYQNKGYTKTHTHPYSDNGIIKTSMLTVWTEEGRRFIHSLFSSNTTLSKAV